MQCPECGYMMSAFEKDCPRCKALDGRKQAGRTIPLPPRQSSQETLYHAPACPQCGADLKPGLQLCTACGTKFPAPVAAPVPAPQPQYAPVYAPPQQHPGPAPQVVIYNNVAPPSYPQAPLPYTGQGYSDGEFIQMPAGSHNVAMSVILALLLTGGGQFVNRQIGKGFAVLVAGLGFGIASNGIGWLVVAIFALADAVAIAQKLNRGEAVRKWQWF